MVVRVEFDRVMFGWRRRVPDRVVRVGVRLLARVHLEVGQVERNPAGLLVLLLDRARLEVDLDLARARAVLRLKAGACGDQADSGRLGALCQLQPTLLPGLTGAVCR